MELNSELANVIQMFSTLGDVMYAEAEEEHSSFKEWIDNSINFWMLRRNQHLVDGYSKYRSKRTACDMIDMLQTFRHSVFKRYKRGYYITNSPDNKPVYEGDQVKITNKKTKEVHKGFLLVGEIGAEAGRYCYYDPYMRVDGSLRRFSKGKHEFKLIKRGE